MKRLTVAASCAALLATSTLAGCATRAANIEADYVPPSRFADLNCDQVREEFYRVSQKVASLSKRQDRKATNDAWATGVGIVLFWPALFFLVTEDHRDQLAELKGEYEALERVAHEKNCPVAEELRQGRRAQGMM